MNLGELIQRMHTKLGEQSLFYPDREILVNGLNPAQRLLCLHFPSLLQKRVLLTLQPDQVLTDLRESSRTIRRVRRVNLGDTTGDTGVVSAATGELGKLHPTTIAKLSVRSDWLRHTGATKNYWLWGVFWFGVYPRPIAELTLTLVCDAMPVPLQTDYPYGEPEITAVHHELMTDIAVGLLLQKEGMPIAGRGLAEIVNALRGVQGGGGGR